MALRTLELVLVVAALLHGGSAGVKEKLPEGVECKQELKALLPGNQTIPGPRAEDLPDCYSEFETEFYDEDSGTRVVRGRFNGTRFSLPRVSRVEDLNFYFKSLRIVVRVASQRGWKNLKFPSFCIHKNATAPLGYCPSKWKEADSKTGLWKAERSPFEKIFLEIQWPEDEEPRDIYISIHRDTVHHRIVWLVAGLLLMPLADTLSKIVVLYYGVGMSVGVLLVVGILVFQLMKLLPLTRGSSARVVFAGAVMGMGGLLVTWLSGLASEAADYFGFGDHFVNPLVSLGLLLVVLIGAAMGFWFVRKLVVLPSGELDPSTIVFVRTALWGTAASLLIMSSSDAVLGAAALCLGVLLTLLVSYGPALTRKLGRSAQLRIGRRDGEDALDEADIPGPQSASGSQINNTPALKQAFVSSYHHIDGRRLMTPQTVSAISKEATRAALADLVQSPGFGTWASQNLSRFVIMPEDKKEQRTRSEISATAWMEEGPNEEEE